MTIRLLTPRGVWPVNAIVTLDAATETALVAEGQASTNLAGGVPYAPVDPTDRSIPVRQNPATGGLVGANGQVIEIGAAPLKLSAPAGTATGSTITATPGTGWAVGGYQWTRDGADISGATSSTYTLTLADEGALLGCRAVNPVFAALLQIPAGSYPAGYLALNGSVVALSGGVLSLV